MVSDLIINDIGNVDLHARHKVKLTKVDSSNIARSLVTDQHLIDKLFTLKK